MAARSPAARQAVKRRSAGKALVRSMHHLAFRCRDAEETRHFYQDVMGMKLAAALDLSMDEVRPQQFATAPKHGPFRFMHLFFEMGDGNFIAFFDVPASAPESLFEPQWGMDRHVAFEVAGEREAKLMQRRWQKAGTHTWGPIDHGFVNSVYAMDPNGIVIEATYKTRSYRKTMREENRTARAVIRRWQRETAPLRVRGAEK